VFLYREDLKMDEKTIQACETAFDFLYAKMHGYGYNMMYIDFPLKVAELSTYFRVKEVGSPAEADSVTYPGLPAGEHVYQVSWDRAYD
jgi:hypothetical protein